MYKYSPRYGLQAGPVRQAGIMAMFERVIDRLVDNIGTLQVRWGVYLDTIDLSESITLEYPEKIIRLPHVVLSLQSEAMREPGIGRIMVDDEEYTGFTKIVQFYFDIWARSSLERMLVSDAVVYWLARSTKHFRQFGIREIKHVGSQSRNYEQESSALYQRMTVQQASRVFRQILQYQVEYDLVTVPFEPAEIIEQIIVSGDVEISETVSAPFETIIGGVTALILDKGLITDAFEDVDISW